MTFSPVALRDRRSIEAWYRKESPAAARLFRQRLREALDFLADYPHGAPILWLDRRGKRIDGFPYTVIYQVQHDGIRVVAIAAERRKPGDYAHR
ncbi:MAG TPA: type II toxin-antitoxin system RelE/ParE family toxin [Thermoanaerobaculia bacterium]|nr:type II toxin-antitoxin system RelE/ParE family toxin [Thermoanaerobaculia bacterium]